MVRADRVYVDPRALLKLYVHERESPAVVAWRRRTAGALPLTAHSRLEVVNGICLAGSRNAIGGDAVEDALASLQEDLDEGRYVEVDAPWRAALRRAGELSRAHTSRLGCRTLDVLHVAVALEVDLPWFATFDRRQQQLARAAGLKIVRLS